MKVQVLRKSGRNTPINTSIFLLRYDEVLKNNWFRKNYITIGSIIDLPEENLKIAQQRNPDLLLIPFEEAQPVEQNEKILDALPKTTKQKK